ncbi:YggS family pyridoxal phosphate-dependent enzyme [Rurimicrobium arvi]|uniref:Pyridoxal phosphate homeostasis protein n=1 Tax=Rurimicrobium arvi TaxID=2049916 RepID=A0ABP8MQ93_9BACT
MNEVLWHDLRQECAARNATLVAVSKTKPATDIAELYALGQRDFGENYVQELVDKHAQLPKDIHWHFIGHLQRNKVKYIAPFVHLIHAVDSMELLEEIQKQAARCQRSIDILLQLHVAREETKYGLDQAELAALLSIYNTAPERFANVRICGLMAMASFTEDSRQVRDEFAAVHQQFEQIKMQYPGMSGHFSVCSMGMSGDYNIALEEGSTMLRIGSMLFGKRN